MLALRAGAWLGGGVVIGAFHFLTLRWNVGMLILGRRLSAALALQGGRFALLVGVLAVIVGRCGAPPLLLAAAGIFAARVAAVRWGVPT